MASLIRGTVVAKNIRSALQADVMHLRERGMNTVLKIIQVGGRPDSSSYIGQKMRAAAEIGIEAEHINLPRSFSGHDLLSLVQKISHSDDVAGLIVQLPLDAEEDIDTSAVLAAIHPDKDVDGLHPINAGKVGRAELTNTLVSCTPKGCMELIKSTGVQIEGKVAVVIGRSKIVGMPMAHLLLSSNATVTICHSRTKNMSDITRQADILVAAVGQAEMVRRDWVKPGAVVIDCGINFIADSTKKSGKRMVGDVMFDEVSEVAGYISPVPGGVGPLTVAMLMANTVQSAQKLLAARRLKLF